MGAERPSPMRGALKLGMGAERPSPTHGALKTGGVPKWTRQPPIFFVDKSRNLSKIVSVLPSAAVERFDVSRMRDFLER